MTFLKPAFARKPIGSMLYKIMSAYVTQPMKLPMHGPGESLGCHLLSTSYLDFISVKLSCPTYISLLNMEHNKLIPDSQLTYTSEGSPACSYFNLLLPLVSVQMLPSD